MKSSRLNSIIGIGALGAILAGSVALSAGNQGAESTGAAGSRDDSSPTEDTSGTTGIMGTPDSRRDTAPPAPDGADQMDTDTTPGAAGERNPSVPTPKADGTMTPGSRAPDTAAGATGTRETAPGMTDPGETTGTPDSTQTPTSPGAPGTRDTAPAEGDIAVPAAEGEEIQVADLSTDEIRQIQEALNQRGANVTVDGIFGSETRQALENFQQEQGMMAPGRLDSETMNRLGIEMEDRSPE